MTSTSKNLCTIDIVDTTKLPSQIKKLIINDFTKQCTGPANNNDINPINPLKVSQSYGRGQLSKSNFVIFAQRESYIQSRTTRSMTRSGTQQNTRRKTTQLCGFLFLHILVDKFKYKYGYIDVVCSSKRYGKKLVVAAEEFCKNIHNCKYMKLSSLNYIRKNGFMLIRDFYEKMGYEHVNNPCSAIKTKHIKGNDTHGYRMTKCLQMNTASTKNAFAVGRTPPKEARAPSGRTRKRENQKINDLMNMSRRKLYQIKSNNENMYYNSQTSDESNKTIY